MKRCSHSICGIWPETPTDISKQHGQAEASACMQNSTSAGSTRCMRTVHTASQPGGTAHQLSQIWCTGHSRSQSPVQPTYVTLMSSPLSEIGTPRSPGTQQSRCCHQYGFAHSVTLISSPLKSGLPRTIGTQSRCHCHQLQTWLCYY